MKQRMKHHENKFEALIEYGICQPSSQHKETDNVFSVLLMVKRNDRAGNVVSTVKDKLTRKEAEALLLKCEAQTRGVK